MKKVIKIAHIYHDLLNLYGENGNVRALRTFIERQGVDCEVHNISFGDKLDFSSYDLYYMGSGMEEAEYMALSELYDYKNDIKNAIENGKTFLITGNAMEMFGAKIRLRSTRNVAGLDIFEYNAVESESRNVSELFYECEELPIDEGRDVVGFKNCNSNIMNNTYNRMFKFPDNIHYKNFYGMMFVGPVCVRNPYFTDYILENLFDELGLKYEPRTDTIEYKAYHEFVNNFIRNSNLD